jgi:hypothetical protein
MLPSRCLFHARRSRQRANQPGLSLSAFSLAMRPPQPRDSVECEPNRRACRALDCRNDRDRAVGEARVRTIPICRYCVDRPRQRRPTTWRRESGAALPHRGIEESIVPRRPVGAVYAWDVWRCFPALGGVDGRWLGAGRLGVRHRVGQRLPRVPVVSELLAADRAGVRVRPVALRSLVVGRAACTRCGRDRRAVAVHVGVPGGDFAASGGRECLLDQGRPQCRLCTQDDQSAACRAIGVVRVSRATGSRGGESHPSGPGSVSDGPRRARRAARPSRDASAAIAAAGAGAAPTPARPGRGRDGGAPGELPQRP